MRAEVEKYMAGWREGDVGKILAAVSEDCVIIESHGPVYRGREVVRRWAEDWFASGSRVLKWEITSFRTQGNEATWEWVFEYGSATHPPSRLEGMSVAKFNPDGQITRLREYQTTERLYDWTGD